MTCRQQYEKTGRVRSKDIMEELGFSKPTISFAMKNLCENDYFTMDADRFITLTPKGRSVVEKVYFRHNTHTKFLVLLGVSETYAREDACRIEHIISQESFDRLTDYLAHNKK